MDIKKIQSIIAEFATERDWDQFHNPKNLAIAMSVECSEFLEEFQWLTLEQASEVMSDHDKAQRVTDELADVAVYLLRLADKLNIDLESAIHTKIDKNREKYPVEKFKGLARKYNEI
ncbi:nucleotide pyrophosphohydrolase [Hahella sp. CCB-MM4]|uniref:nucleotide pyrophosphohydrolase n=1 Tax=Hahella sp. (strain CCB-MM4) TaxID=1926491 RepID=UPI000B9B40A5|nr:nucleotide pyrophosphohydrolase [Hahella sp. CCB-MM4]OZG74387.1 nucleotide pyrophosphohydrolase [Hahella sp. CCB-MM4]